MNVSLMFVFSGYYYLETGLFALAFSRTSFASSSKFHCTRILSTIPTITLVYLHDDSLVDSKLSDDVGQQQMPMVLGRWVLEGLTVSLFFDDRFKLKI